jgi:hypothetical protein
MDASLNAAEKVRRQLKAGPKPKTRMLPSLYEAVMRLCAAADKGRTLMERSGLNPEDIRVALMFRTDSQIGSKPLPVPPTPEAIGAYYTSLETIANTSPVAFLGIMWEQVDRAPAKGKAPRNVWFTQFANDERAALEMLAFRNALVSRGEQ